MSSLDKTETKPGSQGDFLPSKNSSWVGLKKLERLLSKLNKNAFRIEIKTTKSDTDLLHERNMYNILLRSRSFDESPYDMNNPRSRQTWNMMNKLNHLYDSEGSKGILSTLECEGVSVKSGQSLTKKRTFQTSSLGFEDTDDSETHDSSSFSSVIEPNIFTTKRRPLRKRKQIRMVDSELEGNTSSSRISERYSSLSYQFDGCGDSSLESIVIGDQFLNIDEEENWSWQKDHKDGFRLSSPCNIDHARKLDLPRITLEPFEIPDFNRKKSFIRKCLTFGLKMATCGCTRTARSRTYDGQNSKGSLQDNINEKQTRRECKNI